MGPITFLTAVGKRKITCPSQESNRDLETVAYRYTDRAVIHIKALGFPCNEVIRNNEGVDTMPRVLAGQSMGRGFITA
jgi:hypothetical protein